MNREDATIKEERDVRVAGVKGSQVTEASEIRSYWVSGGGAASKWGKVEARTVREGDGQRGGIDNAHCDLDRKVVGTRGHGNLGGMDEVRDRW